VGKLQTPRKEEVGRIPEECLTSPFLTFGLFTSLEFGVFNFSVLLEGVLE
jgi:hypothetical protein